MLGIKAKTTNTTSYPETFYLDYKYVTMAMDHETRKFLDHLRFGVAYKGRYIDAYGVKLELEAFKGIKLSSHFFSTEPCRWLPNGKKIYLSHSQGWVFFK